MPFLYNLPLLKFLLNLIVEFIKSARFNKYLTEESEPGLVSALNVLNFVFLTQTSEPIFMKLGATTRYSKPNIIYNYNNYTNR